MLPHHKYMLYVYIPVLNYMARFSSDSQRESRHHFDETINNVVLYSAVVGRVYVIERRVLLETSAQQFFFLPFFAAMQIAD